MKWLAGGLTFVNIATVCSLLLGMAHSGLNKAVVLVSLGVATITGVIAALETKACYRERNLTKTTFRNYNILWLWLIVACFAMFSLRSFCWLLYFDGNDLKIQSPNNLGDIALHITHIRNFASGVALWPENPIYTFSNLRYPAGIDLFSALFSLLHFDIRQNLIWMALLGSLATCYALWRWGGAFGIAGFLFNGGLAGFQIFSTRQWLDYQGGPDVAWKSIPLAMFVTQRGLLYAIPAGLLLLVQWRARFFPEPNESGQDVASPPLPFWVECSLYASMPLFHVHTFLALSLLLGVWFIIGSWARRRQLLLLVGYSFLPATFFTWLITDHFQAHSILELKPGWVRADVHDTFYRPFFEFWTFNFGIIIPLVILLVGICGWRAWKSNLRSLHDLPRNLAFLVPAVLLFLFACNVKTAPWYWDNTKLLVWAYLLVLPFLWRDLIGRWPLEVRAGVCVALFGSGFVSLFGGLAAGQPGFTFASRAEVDSVGQAVKNLPPAARFAAYPTYNHPLLLNGRKVVLGYPGHIWSQGFDYGPTMQELTALMDGESDWEQIARDLHARFLFWGPDEKINYPASSRPWEKVSLKVSAGDWGAIYDLTGRQKSRTVP